jgi:hypothetical protein
VHGTKKKKNNKKKKKKKIKDMMIASMPSTADISLYMLLDSSSLVSVPYSTPHSVPSLPSLHQYTASNAMKAAKMKEERMNVCDEAAKYPDNSIDLHDYHAWCVDKNGDVCDYSNETLMKSVEHPSLEVICQLFTANIIPKWLVICKDQYNIDIQNMANANCGGDIDVMIAQLTIVLIAKPSHFPDQCCYPRAKLLHHYNPQIYSLVIGSLGFRHADGTIHWEYG